MKKTYNINLNSQVFCIDEDAYIRLKNYIETLEKYYLNEEDGKEIMFDIESRIAELFSESLQRSHKQVISQHDIDKIIEVMGTPDVIIDEDAEHASLPSQNGRKLYRNMDHAILGGVASGLAAYFAISPIWFRLIFIVFSFIFGITILCYILLWIILPRAVTAKQKLEMKGEKINVSNIEKNIRDTYTKVKTNSGFQKNVNYIGSQISTYFSALKEIFQKILSILGHFIAGVGLLAGTFFFLLVCWGIFFSFHLLPENYYPFLKFLCAPVPVWLIKLVLLCFINIPLILIVYYSIAYLFRFQGRKSFLAITGLIWLLSCFAMIFLGMYFFTNNMHLYSTRHDVSFPASTVNSKTVNIKFRRLCPSAETFNTSFSLDRYLLHCPDQSEDSMLYLQPRLKFALTNQPEPQLVLFRKARGFSDIDGNSNLENIQYTYKWENDTLLLNDYFTLEKPRLRANELQITVLIPENYKVNLQNTPWWQIRDYKFYFSQPYYLLQEKSNNQQFIMKEGKLTKFSK